MKPVGAFHLGPQKTATTWIYRCVAAHPGVAAPPTDSIHYFDMHYARGEAWYAGHFAEAAPGRVRFDPTASYLRSPWAPRRIARHNPAARLALCVRDPIQRAFSHWWHERKKGVARHRFSDVLVNYDLFAAWLEPGFYAEHLGRYLDHFPRDQILVQRFERVREDPGGFIAELMGFFGLEPRVAPELLRRPVNVAGARRDAIGLGLYAGQKTLRVLRLRRWADRLARSPLLSGRAEYLRGVPDDLFERLLEVCEPEIARLESMLGIDLAAWRTNRSHVTVAA